jgi:prolipoprotein diacylglyceryl transferase
VPGSAFSAVRREQIRSRSVLFWSIPSPTSRFLVDSGPLHIRWYGLLLALGVLWGAAVARRELRRRSIDPDLTYAIALWVVPLGLIGARLYHVATDWSTLFAGHWERIPKVWEGGLGIYGALIGGMIGGAIAARRYGIALPVLLDCIAPGTALAQALGRFGNYFNQELFGRPTDLPWALHITCANQELPCSGQGYYHPTFLYEVLWDIGVAALVIWADRRFRLGHGRAFALYVATYTLGRAWIEALRIDDAHHFLGLRLNDWTSLLVFVGAVSAFVVSRRRHPGRETPEELEARRTRIDLTTTPAVVGDSGGDGEPVDATPPTEPATTQHTSGEGPA